jgi:hypothetical protein
MNIYGGVEVQIHANFNTVGMCFEEQQGGGRDVGVHAGKASLG